MKIRIKNNSIRRRLTRSEIDRFAADGHLEDRTEFVNSVFVYSLQRTTQEPQLSADFKDGKVTVWVPEAIATEWTTTDAVGYSHTMDIGGGHGLFLLIEKDFKCIDNTTEDQSDNYEHPTSECA